MADYKSLIFSSRPFVMGIASIMILLFHQVWLHGHVWTLFHTVGHWGVDIFVFLSGYGIASSLEKCELRVFCYRRFIRLIPTCLIVGVVNVVSRCVLYDDVTWANFLFYLFCLNQWYIDAIILYYVLSPLLVRLLKKRQSLILVVLMVLITYFSIYIDNPIWPLNWALERLPMYCLGIWFFHNPFNMNRWYIFICLLVGLYLFLLIVLHLNMPPGGGAVRYLFLLPIMPLFIVSLSRCSKYVDGTPLGKMISWCGVCSLELYLVQCLCFDIIGSFSFASPVLPFVMGVLITFAFSFFAKKLLENYFR